ncbi:MAG TPA: hypothetical protein VII53_04185 [Solirubrobacteraceae bacterium]
MKGVRRLAVAGAVWACLLACPVAHAFAGVGHEHLSQIPGFATPWGLTFDSGGSLYVDNTLASVGEVDVINAKDEQQPSIGLGTLVEGRVLSTKYARNASVDRATGYVYVADSGPDGVYVFKPVGGGVYENISFWTGANAGGFGGGYVSVAVDNNPPSLSDPHGGDVYVESSSNRAVDILRPNPPGPTEAEEGVSEGELERPPEGFSFQENVAMAVDGTGKVYVPNSGDRVVDEFSGSGAFLQVLNGVETPAKAFGEPIAAAVDESTSDLYVVDKTNHVVDQFDSAGNYKADIKGSLKQPLGVAIQNLVGPAEGDVYVSDGEAGVVEIFGPDVVGPAPLVNTGLPKQETPTTATATGTVDPEGSSTTDWFDYGPTEAYGSETTHEPAGEGTADVTAEANLENLEPHKTYHYRLAGENAFGLSDGQDQTLTTSSERPSIESGSEAADSITGFGAKLHVRANPENEATRYYFEYGTSPTLQSASTSPTPPGEIPAGRYGDEALDTDVTGLHGNTVYYYRAVAENGAGRTEGTIETFQTTPGPPIVATGSLPSASAGSATAIGTINPETLETTYYYQYGTSLAYEQSTPAASAGSGSTDVPALGTLSDLSASTRYHYRLVATNDVGTSYGEDETFTTPAGATPTAITGGASGVTSTAATISATIATLDLPTNYGFQVGTEAGSYGPATGFASISPGRGEVTVTLALQNLEPGATYHYRAIASNLYGPAAGADQVFTTPAIPTPLSLPITALLVTTPAVAFPGETQSDDSPRPKVLTRGQKLAKALKACKAKPKKQRAACEKQAEKQYGRVAKKKTKKK